MLAIKAGPRKGSRRANQPFLLLPDSTALASRVSVSEFERFALDGFLEERFRGMPYETFYSGKLNLRNPGIFPWLAYKYAYRCLPPGFRFQTIFHESGVDEAKNDYWMPIAFSNDPSNLQRRFHIVPFRLSSRIASGLTIFFNFDILVQAADRLLQLRAPRELSVAG